MKKLTATFVVLLLATQLAPPTLAKSKGDWSTVKSFANYTVAVKTTSGETHYGLLQTVDDAGLELGIAGSDDLTGQQISIRRTDVLKVWRADLRFGQKHIGKGALLGAGAGLGVAFIAAATCSYPCQDPGAGLGSFLVYGAIAGAVAGKFWRKGHKKEYLIYSRG